jgi:hypothetical protein
VLVLNMSELIKMGLLVKLEFLDVFILFKFHLTEVGFL